MENRMPQKIDSQYDLDIFPTDYFDLPEEAIAENIERLCKRPGRPASYYHGRRKGVEMLLTLEWAEIEHLAEFYVVSDAHDDDEATEHLSNLNDPIMGQILRAEIARNSALYKNGSALIAFENGILDAIRDAYADLQRCVTLLEKYDPASEVPNE